MSNQEPVKDDHSEELETFDHDRNDAPDLVDSPSDLGDLGGDDLEAAYLKAMSALEASEWEIGNGASEASASDPEIEEPASEPNHTDRATGESKAADSPIATSEKSPSEAIDSLPSSEVVNSAESNLLNRSVAESRVTPRQIIEACLFVGGTALTSSKISGILRGEFDSDFIDREIDELNRQYAAQSRPYEIRFGEGGYRMALREEFERIRHKVYGLGPKEVRLSQEALEVLAVVAYHQPIKQAQVEELGKPDCGAVLRQLVRRELLVVERDPKHPREVSYKTTPRFLSLFGIRSLEELPRHEQVSYK